MNKNESIYIASPYSHADKDIEKNRYETAVQFVAEMMNRGYVVYSPIVFGHPVAITHKLPTTWDYWKKFLTVQLKCHNRLLVLTLPGWDLSSGVKEEIRLATEWGIPITYASFDPTSTQIQIKEDRDYRIVDFL